MRHESATHTVAHQPLMTVAEVAARFRVSRQTVYNLIHSGALPAAVLGQGSVRPRGYRVPEAAVTAHFAKRVATGTA